MEVLSEGAADERPPRPLSDAGRRDDPASRAARAAGAAAPVVHAIDEFEETHL
jgi:hypothetical protein